MVRVPTGIAATIFSRKKRRKTFSRPCKKVSSVFGAVVTWSEKRWYH